MWILPDLLPAHLLGTARRQVNDIEAVLCTCRKIEKLQQVMNSCLFRTGI